MTNDYYISRCLIYKLLERGIASTGAAFPVTSLYGPRARFCLSAGHSDEMIDHALKCLDEIGTEIGIKFDEVKVKPVNKSSALNGKLKYTSNIVF